MVALRPPASLPRLAPLKFLLARSGLLRSGLLLELVHPVERLPQDGLTRASDAASSLFTASSSADSCMIFFCMERSFSLPLAMTPSRSATVATPAAIVTRLNGEANKFIKTKEFSERIAADGAEPAGGTPEIFAALIRSEIVKWAAVVKHAGLAGK